MNVLFVGLLVGIGKFRTVIVSMQHLSEKPEVHFHDFAISSFLFFLHFAHTFG